MMLEAIFVNDAMTLGQRAVVSDGMPPYDGDILNNLMIWY